MSDRRWSPNHTGNAGENIPLAYFLTFTCYGTWLHGDERGSIDPWHRLAGTARIPPSPHRVRLDAGRVTGASMALDPARRSVVDGSVRQTCAALGSHLRALNVRTNHVHAVVVADKQPEQVMTALKAYSTRRMRELGLVAPGARVWTRHGSTRYLWKPEDVEAACNYVIHGQGDELPR